MSCDDHGLHNCPRFPLLPVWHAAKAFYASLKPTDIDCVEGEWRILDRNGSYMRGSQRMELFSYSQGKLNNMTAHDRPEFLSSVLKVSAVGVPTAIQLPSDLAEKLFPGHGEKATFTLFISVLKAKTVSICVSAPSDRRYLIDVTFRAGSRLFARTMSRLGWDTREITELQAKDEDDSWWGLEDAFLHDYYRHLDNLRLSPDDGPQFKHKFLSSTLRRVEGPGENH